jgi:hypothetical protein
MNRNRARVGAGRVVWRGSYVGRYWEGWDVLGMVCLVGRVGKVRSGIDERWMTVGRWIMGNWDDGICYGIGSAE